MTADRKPRLPRFRPLRRSLHLIKDGYRYAAFRPSWFRGLHRTFAEALAAAPRHALTGYDHDAVASGYRVPELRLAPCDYALLFHLTRMLADAGEATVLDFGGNVGIHYLRYSPYLSDRVRWIVCDLPAITRVGHELAAAMPALEFVNDIAALRVERLDVLLASDAVQYVETLDPPGRLLQTLIAQGTAPRHVLFDQLPLQEGPTFVTLQNAGPACYPFYVFNRGQFLAGLAGLDYELRADWNDDAGVFAVPFHRSRPFLYQGFYFRRRS